MATENSKTTKSKSPCSVCYIVVAFLALCLAAASFAIGVLWTQQNYIGGNPLGNQGANNDQGAGAVEDLSGNLPKITKNDHVKGDRNANISLIEYSDFQCPFCKRFHETAQQAIDDYNGEVNWVYRHFPLDSLHPFARKMSEASECVFEQKGEDTFWEYTAALFETSITSQEQIVTVAADFGVDTAQLTTCLDDGKYAERVNKDAEGGAKAGVRGTPGNFVINNKTGKVLVIPGAVPLTQLTEAIDSLL